MVNFPSGFRLFKKANPFKEPSTKTLTQDLKNFQEVSLNYLRNVREPLKGMGTAEVRSLTDRFYPIYRDFTAKKDFFKKAGGTLYMEYRVFVLSLGPVYESINDYINNPSINTAQKTRKVLTILDKALATLSQQDIPSIKENIAAK